MSEITLPTTLTEIDDDVLKQIKLGTAFPLTKIVLPGPRAAPARRTDPQSAASKRLRHRPPDRRRQPSVDQAIRQDHARCFTWSNHGRTATHSIRCERNHPHHRHMHHMHHTHTGPDRRFHLNRIPCSPSKQPRHRPSRSPPPPTPSPTTVPTMGPTISEPTFPPSPVDHHRSHPSLDHIPAPAPAPTTTGPTSAPTTIKPTAAPTPSPPATDTSHASNTNCALDDVDDWTLTAARSSSCVEQP